MLETSGVGARLDLSALPAPEEVEPFRWLNAFPSFGFVLSMEPSAVSAVCARFAAAGVSAACVGEVTGERTLVLESGAERAEYWNMREPLTGFGAGAERAS